MTKIERLVVNGVGNQTVDVTGWRFAKVETDGSGIEIELVGPGGYSQRYNDDDRLIIPSSITSLKISQATGEAWKLHMQKTVPAVNQSELKLMKTESGKLLIEGDCDIRFRGQDTEATADITGIKDDLENLSKLYEKALSTGAVSDAAKYCKLRTAVLARYAN